MKVYDEKGRLVDAVCLPFRDGDTYRLKDGSIVVAKIPEGRAVPRITSRLAEQAATC